MNGSLRLEHSPPQRPTHAREGSISQEAQPRAEIANGVLGTAQLNFLSGRAAPQNVCQHLRERATAAFGCSIESFERECSLFLKICREVDSHLGLSSSSGSGKLGYGRRSGSISQPPSFECRFLVWDATWICPSVHGSFGLVQEEMQDSLTSLAQKSNN